MYMRNVVQVARLFSYINMLWKPRLQRYLGIVITWVGTLNVKYYVLLDYPVLYNVELFEYLRSIELVEEFELLNFFESLEFPPPRIMTSSIVCMITVKPCRLPAQAR